METIDYLNELRKELGKLDKNKKEEIIKEIESYIVESEADYSLLIEKFGEPKELASCYLEDISAQNVNKDSLKNKSKRAFKTIFFFLLIVGIVIASFIYYKTKDDFDYSKFDANSVTKHFETAWLELKNTSSIDIAQSKVIIYWNNEEKTKISCKSDDEDKKYKFSIEDDSLIIKQSYCYLSLPKKDIELKTYQARVVLVKPQSSINLDSEQSRIEVAKKDEKYIFKLDKKQSDMDDLVSDSQGIVIDGKIYQSKITFYKY